MEYWLLDHGSAVVLAWWGAFAVAVLASWRFIPEIFRAIGWMDSEGLAPRMMRGLLALSLSVPIGFGAAQAAAALAATMLPR
jgi:hypothetical protein